MRTTLRVIDSISELSGKVVCWLASILVALITLEVIMRYFFNASTMWNFETSMMTGGTLYVVGWAYALRHHSHISIDVLYNRLSPRAKAGIYVAGYLLFFFPLMALFVSASIAWAWHAWEINEKSVETYWYPQIAPFRTIVAIGFCLFAVQGVADFIRNLYLLIRNKSCD